MKPLKSPTSKQNEWNDGKYSQLTIHERINFKNNRQLHYWLQHYCGYGQMIFDEVITENLYPHFYFMPFRTMVEYKNFLNN